MLYCPKCGAEYREGYSSCSDCRVLLTRERLDAERFNTTRERRAEPGNSEGDPFAHFWGGDDSRLYGELCSLLDEAEIPHMTIRKEDRLFRVSTQPYFELVVPSSQIAKAKSVTQYAFGEMPQLSDPDARTDADSDSGASGESRKFVRNWAEKGLLPAILEKLRQPLPPRETKARSKDPDDWFPEDATTEVWSGQDETLPEMISISLRENDIPSRVDDLKNLRLVFVQPQDESRAREIVREIIEGTPPE